MLNRVVDKAGKVIEEVGGIIKESVEGVADGVKKAGESGKKLIEKIEPQSRLPTNVPADSVAKPIEIAAQIAENDEDASWSTAYKKMKEAGWVK